jgi:hypothetical protein
VKKLKFNHSQLYFHKLLFCNSPIKFPAWTGRRIVDLLVFVDCPGVSFIELATGIGGKKKKNKNP